MDTGKSDKSSVCMIYNPCFTFQRIRRICDIVEIKKNNQHTKIAKHKNLHNKMQPNL